MARTRLIITADDYGYFDRYDEGILEVARAGAIDAVSAFATRPGLRAEPLLETGVEIGLHLDLPEPGDAPRASDDEREHATRELQRQYESFGDRFGRPPAYLDGHHHCHAREGLGTVVAGFALEHGLPVRSCGGRQRRWLRCRGIATPDLLIGRIRESQPVLPAELGRQAATGLPEVVEWMVHPGYAAGRDSAYDAGREEDIGLLLRWAPPSGVERSTHRVALPVAVSSPSGR